MERICVLSVTSEEESLLETSIVKENTQDPTRQGNVL